MRHAAVLVLALCCGAGMVHAAESDLQRQQAAAQRDKQALRERLQSLEKEIAGVESTRRDVTTALKESETAISELDRRLLELSEETEQARALLGELRDKIEDQTEELARRRGYLAEQLRAQYASGLSPWATLLSGEDPQDIARELGYLEYVARAQAKAVRSVNTALAELTNLRKQAEAQEQRLQGLAKEATEKRAELDAQRLKRLAVLESIEAELKQQRGEAERLAHNERRLGDLVDALSIAIEQEAEAARKREEEARRIEEERRLAEARRLEEEKRLAEERRRIELAAQEQKRREAELAEQERRRQEAEAGRVAGQAQEAEKIAAARAAAEAARKQKEDAPPAEPLRIRGKVDGIAAVGPAESEVQSERAETSMQSAEAATVTAPVQVARIEQPERKPPVPRPSVSLNGLTKGLPYPVRGDVQGRFGMERPEGGVWRGIVLRANEGAQVAAIAPGRVVYAGWLGGFGNLMIVDHGAKYLSVYGYNQSLLKQVGDQVNAGENIATVGATGGQVEPGLYFEIRHEGKPVNPLLWLGG